MPAWGYAEVVESKLTSLAPGMLLFGFWPTTSLPIDLELQAAAGVANQWIEVNPARKNLMNLYNRYYLFDADRRLGNASDKVVQDMAWEASVRTVSEAGWIISRAIFGSPPIHPLGMGEWTKEDADLSSAVVISLSASGKTARGFNAAVVNCREQGTGPVGFLAVTSQARESLIPPASFPTKVVSYENMASGDTLGWIKSVQPEKIAIVDFGAQGDALLRLVEAVQRSSPDAKVVVIGVGGNSSIRTSDDLVQHFQRKLPFERIQMNMSPIKDKLMEVEGAGAYLSEYSEAWESLRRSGCLDDLKLEVGKGIAGEDGIEGGWTKLCRGGMPGDVALAYRVG